MSDTASGERTVWGIHMEWDDGSTPPDTKEIAIGWPALGDLSALPASRDAFKAAYKLFLTFPTRWPTGQAIMPADG